MAVLVGGHKTEPGPVYKSGGTVQDCGFWVEETKLCLLKHRMKRMC